MFGYTRFRFCENGFFDVNNISFDKAVYQISRFFLFLET